MGKHGHHHGHSGGGHKPSFGGGGHHHRHHHSPPPPPPRHHSCQNNNTSNSLMMGMMLGSTGNSDLATGLAINEALHGHTGNANALLVGSSLSSNTNQRNHSRASVNYDYERLRREERERQRTAEAEAMREREAEAERRRQEEALFLNNLVSQTRIDCSFLVNNSNRITKAHARHLIDNTAPMHVLLWLLDQQLLNVTDSKVRADAFIQLVKSCGSSVDYHRVLTWYTFDKRFDVQTLYSELQSVGANALEISLHVAKLAGDRGILFAPFDAAWLTHFIAQKQKSIDNPLTHLTINQPSLITDNFLKLDQSNQLLLVSMAPNLFNSTHYREAFGFKWMVDENSQGNSYPLSTMMKDEAHVMLQADCMSTLKDADVNALSSLLSVVTQAMTQVINENNRTTTQGKEAKRKSLITRDQLLLTVVTEIFKKETSVDAIVKLALDTETAWKADGRYSPAVLSAMLKVAKTEVLSRLAADLNTPKKGVEAFLAKNRTTHYFFCMPFQFTMFSTPSMGVYKDMTAHKDVSLALEREKARGDEEVSQVMRLR
jgi:hypothetical protein